MRFEIEGQPIPKARPRFMSRGGYVVTYDPQQEAKTWVKHVLQKQLRDALDSDNKQLALSAANLARGGGYMVKMWFYIEVPKSNSQSDRNAKLWGLEECICKPDLDNLEKFYLDCCAGSLFPDDKHVFLLKSTKKYANSPKVVIDIVGRKPMNVNEKIRGILQIFGPDQLMKLIEDVMELYELYDVDEEDDWLVDKVGAEDTRNVRLARTAYILSLVAANHGKAFDKIQKKFPDFWKDAERIAREVEDARRGEFNVLEEKEGTSSVCSVLNGQTESSRNGAERIHQFEEGPSYFDDIGDHTGSEQWPKQAVCDNGVSSK